MLAGECLNERYLILCSRFIFTLLPGLVPGYIATQIALGPINMRRLAHHLRTEP